MKHKYSLQILAVVGLMIGLLSMAISPVQAQGDLLSRINTLRGSLGLSGYSLNGALAAAAQNHAAWMASTGQVSHVQPDGSTPTVRASRAGYPSSAVSENIYMGSNATVDTAWQWWLNSPVHYRGITNAVYTEVGIGTASGEYGTAFVLVFGNPVGWQISAPAGGNAGNNNNNGGGNSGGFNNNAQWAPPPFIVGLDNLGNIMHEVQPGHTLGEIALIYGYDWDDLEYIRSINAMTEEEGRTLSVGSVLLVPPQSGTYTPTPGDPPTATPIQLTAPPPGTVVSIGEILRRTVTPIPSVTPEGPPDSTPVGVAQAESPVLTQVVPPTTTPAPLVTAGWIAATVTPAISDTPQAVAAVPQGTPAEFEQVLEPMVVDFRDADDGGPSPLLIVAIVLQIVLIGAAGVEFWRRSR